MDSAAELKKLAEKLGAARQELVKPLERWGHELEFAAGMLQAHPEQAAQWGPLLEQAAGHVSAGLAAGRGDGAALVGEAEALLAPVGEAAKQYTLFCCGHGHIDMNWMWSWPETVAVCHDTFATVDQLMDEFPEFHYSQSQVSVYLAMQQYAPELFARIRQRVAEGRWEVTASQWVEGDKNLAGGESLCRHLLYTRRWLRENLGLPYEAVKIDWECDTFGHCWTLPGILARGGVTRYYHHRAGAERWRQAQTGEISRLFWWEGKDGSRVLAYDDSPVGYNCEMTPQMGAQALAWERSTGLQEMLWIYGVGDHGGGPTRRHLRAALEMQGWPIWPTLKLTTTDDFFSTVEAKLGEADLPVVREELNYVFEGCYTSQSRIKFANRASENALVEAEAAALLAARVCGRSYPAAELEEAWRRAMFNQFHDILPGSGVRETREHSLGLLQEILATTGLVRTRSLRAIADRVDTSALASAGEDSDQGLGGGAGEGAWWGALSSRGAGQVGADPVVVFNPAPFTRDDVVRVTIWDRPLPEAQVVVRDAAGHALTGQVTDRGGYWGHDFATVVFPARELPPLGYRAYVVEPGDATSAPGGCYLREVGRPVYTAGYMATPYLEPLTLGNELVELTVCGRSGGIISLVDKATGQELVPAGEVLGSLERELEAPHGMTAWMLGPIVGSVPVMENSVLRVAQCAPLAGPGAEVSGRGIGQVTGPHLVAVELVNRYGDSEYRLTISLAAGSPRVDFSLDVNWLERGDPQTGVPVLRTSFPLDLLEGRASFEIPCGFIERPADGGESPALSWADLTGEAVGDPEGALLGAALLNDSKYGYQVSEDALRLTLLRSSYDPDPLPEYGRHQIRWALLPHTGPFSASEATRAGYAFNHPCVTVGTTTHGGELPAEASALEVLTPNVMLSGLKRAEDSEAVILRLYEVEGQETTARVRLASALAAPGTPVVETDLLEQPLASSTARLEGDTLMVTLPPCGIATVRIGG